MLSTDGRAFFIKASSTALYEPSCLVPRFLHNHGLAFVVAPLPTRTDALWTSIDTWTLCLYPFIDGVSGSLPPLTDDQWKATGMALRHVHQTTLPPDGLGALRTEKFDPAMYHQWLEDFALHCTASREIAPIEQELHTLCDMHRATIHQALETLASLAPRLQHNAGDFVLCHADLHSGNLLRSPQGSVHLIDWDDVMLAPKERDFLFVADPPSHDSDPVSPFFHGYGSQSVDWQALAYFRWERIVQDLFAYIDTVCFRQDLPEAAQRKSIQQMRTILNHGVMLRAAYVATNHRA